MNRHLKKEVFARLAAYFRSKADPAGDGSWQGNNARVFDDLVYYELRALQLRSLQQTLGSLNFVKARARLGSGSIEKLLRDYHDAIAVVRSAKYAQLKTQLAAAHTSRSGVLMWLTEFLTFVGTNTSLLLAFPDATFELALNQPDASAPHIAAATLVQAASRSVGQTLFERKAELQQALGRVKDTATAATNTGRLGTTATTQHEAAVVVQRAVRGLLARRAASQKREQRAALRRKLRARAKGLDVDGSGGGKSSKSAGSHRRSKSSSSRGSSRHGTRSGGSELDSAASRVQGAFRSKKKKQKLVSGKRKRALAKKKRRAQKQRLIASRGEGWFGVPKICAVSQGVQVRPDNVPGNIPTCWLEWVNKPQRSRVIAGYNAASCSVECIALDPSPSSLQTVALGMSDGSVATMEVQTGKVVREWKDGAHDAVVNHVCYSPDGRILLSACAAGTIAAWDVGVGSRVCTMRGHDMAVTSVTFLKPTSRGTGAGQAVGATVGADSGLKTTASGATTAVGSPSQYFVSASLDSSMKLWEETASSSGSVMWVCIWTKDWLASPIMCFASCPLLGVLLTGRGDGAIEVWDVRALNLGLLPLRKWSAHPFSHVTALAISHDGRYVASGGSDEEVRLWVHATVLAAEAAARANPSGADQAATEASLITAPLEWEGVKCDGRGHTGSISGLAFSDDGDHLVSSGVDMLLAVWDTQERMQGLALEGHDASVNGVVYLPPQLSAASTTGVIARAVTCGSDRAVNVRHLALAVHPSLWMWRWLLMVTWLACVCVCVCVLVVCVCVRVCVRCLQVWDVGGLDFSLSTSKAVGANECVACVCGSSGTLLG